MIEVNSEFQSRCFKIFRVVLIDVNNEIVSANMRRRQLSLKCWGKGIEVKRKVRMVDFIINSS